MPSILRSQLLTLPKRRVLPPDQSYLPDIPGFLAGTWTEINGPTKWNDEPLNVNGSRLLRDHSKGPVCWTEKSFNNFMHGTFFPDRSGEVFHLSARGFGRPGSLLRRPRTVMLNSGFSDIWNTGADDEVAWFQLLNRMRARFDKHGIDFMGQFGAWPGCILAGIPALKAEAAFDEFMVRDVFNDESHTVIGGLKHIRCTTEFPEILGGDLLVITTSGGFDAYSVEDWSLGGGVGGTGIIFFPTLWPEPMDHDKGMVEEGIALFGSYFNFIQVILDPDNPVNGSIPATSGTEIYEAIIDGLPEDHYELNLRVSPDRYAERAAAIDEVEAKIVEFFNIPEDEDG